MNEKITLSGVPETMLQTVYARARESSGRGAVRDRKAEEIIDRLDYDFSLAEKDSAMRSGVIARHDRAGSADGSMACEKSRCGGREHCLRT